MRKWGGLVIFLLLLTACRSGAKETSPSPSPIPTPAVLPVETPVETTPEAEERFPFLAAENERWQVYVDHYGDLEGDALVEFSVYDQEGKLLQSLSMISPYLHDYSGTQFRDGGLMGFQDLNFDGLPDLWVLYENVRNGAYDAFLWEEETGQFREELSYTELSARSLSENPEEKLIFSCGSSSASSIVWSVHRYVPGEGYQLEYTLVVYSDDDEERPGLAIETRYENGEAVGTVESWDGMGLSDIWDKRTEEFWGE